MTNLWNIILNSGWELKVGDPTLAGWLIAIAYFFCAWLCILKTRRNNSEKMVDKYKSKEMIWKMLAVFMLLMGINKQLDLHSWVMAVGEAFVWQQGWYEQRKIFKWMIFTIIGVIGLATLVFLGWKMGGIWRNNWLILAGVAVLFFFILLRGMAFNRIFIIPLGDLEKEVSQTLELIGIACIGSHILIGFRNDSR